MGWLRNDNQIMNNIVLRYYSEAAYKLNVHLYRSRMNIDADVFKYINMAFRLPNLGPDGNTPVLSINTFAMPRGMDNADTIDAVEKQIAYSTREQLTTSRKVMFFNTSTNQAVVPDLITALKEAGFIEKDFRTALTCTPFHTNTVLQKELCVVVLSNVYTDEVFLKLGAVLPVLYEQAVPEELLNAYLSCDKQQFLDVYYALVKDVEEQKQRQEMLDKLSSLEEMIVSEEARAIDESIANVRNTIEHYNIALRNKAAELQELLIRKSSPLWATQENSVREFINYIKEHDLTNITKLRISPGSRTLTVCIVTPLLYWEDSLFKRYDKASTTNSVTGCDDDKRALLRNIFLDGTVGVTFHTAVAINFATHEIVRSPNTLVYGTSHIGIPHTHVHYHNCWGDNRPLIIKAFGRADYIVMWEQMKATLSGLNIADSIVFDKFIRDLNTGCNTPCLTLKDTGETMNVKTFLTRFPNGYTQEDSSEATNVTAPRERRAPVATEEPTIPF